ncbi:hypothetical protein FAP39_16850 [Shimia litoralis]|uniref:Uncharacterized protein n=1 Tax=Shimia litoralis TaxID=420403 RepID=A0A4U7MSU9_9RHOB|nr:hypothetical protein [Shimia litoralis]TKZ15767.1 hypothetical protein FAP39_16850 [Shimia litoralis]
MSKGRKRRYEEERKARKWVLVYVDTFSFDEPAIVSDPMPYDQALRALNKAREQEGSNGFDHYELQQVAVNKEPKC